MLSLISQCCKWSLIHSLSLHLTGHGWDLMVSSLISLCTVFHFCWHSRSSGLDVFMTQPDVNGSFLCPTIAFLLTVPPRVTLLWSTTCIYLFPTFWFYGKNSSHGATDGRIRAENCLRFGREHKNGLKIPQAHEAISSTSYWSSCSCWWSMDATVGTVREGELPLPSALEQLVKLKFSNFNSADAKLALESVFGSGRLTWPQVTPDVQTQVWRQESCISSQGFAKATLLLTEAGGETEGSFPRPRLTPLACASVSPSLKQRQPGLTMSAIEEITTLHSLLLTLEWHFLYHEWAPQQGIYTWLQHKLAFYQCLLHIPHRGVGRINYLACAEDFEDKMCQVITMCFTDLGMHGHFFLNGLLILLTGSAGQSCVSREVSFFNIILIGFLIAVFTLVTY